jgi:carbon storage regulator CsrA
MLVLTRKLQERIVLSPASKDIVVTVLSIGRTKVRIGIESTDLIMREELLKRDEKRA